MLNFFGYSWNSWFFHDLFDLFEVFRIKLLSTVRHKHVIFIIRFAIKFHIELAICGRWASLSKNVFFMKNIAFGLTLMRNYPRIFVLPTQLQILIKISRIGLPGNSVKICISWDLASLTESDKIFGLKKSPQRKNSFSEFSLCTKGGKKIWFISYEPYDIISFDMLSPG